MSSPGGLSIGRPIEAVYSLLTDRKYFWILASLSVFGDGILTELIIRFVPCANCRLSSSSSASCNHFSDTEIDWETYMIQTQLYLKGEHNYTMITGPTGPLVWVLYVDPIKSLTALSQLPSRASPYSWGLIPIHRRWNQRRVRATDIRCPVSSNSCTIIRHLPQSREFSKCDRPPPSSQQTSPLDICATAVQRLLGCFYCPSCHTSISTRLWWYGQFTVQVCFRPTRCQ